jgi:uncharacterized protein
MSPLLRRKIEKLQKLLRAMGSACLAYSGGVDSSFLAAVAGEVLGCRFLAVTAASETYSDEELREARALARRLGFRHRVIRTRELSCPAFSSNPPKRCYHCKRELFLKLGKLAAREKLGFLLDGQNADDRSDFRPGARAARELGARSPLQEVGLKKSEIRELSRAMKLPTWNRPAAACLASRIPYGQRITAGRLRRIAAAEKFLRSLGLGQLRLRDHGTIARIEGPAADIRKLCGAARGKVVRQLKRLGWTYVTLDLEGYRMGSLNEGMGKRWFPLSLTLPLRERAGGEGSALSKRSTFNTQRPTSKSGQPALER